MFMQKPEIQTGLKQNKREFRHGKKIHKQRKRQKESESERKKGAKHVATGT